MKKLMTGENGLGKFLKFKLSTTAVGGRAGLSDQSAKYFNFEDILVNDDAQKIWMSSNENDFSIFPTFHIKDDVHILGNIFNTNYKQERSYTKLELKVDMLEIYLEAQTRINELYEFYLRDTPFSKISYLDDPEHQEVWPLPLTFHEKYQEDIMAAYMDSFDTFNQSTIRQILALQDEIDGRIDTEKLHADEEEQLHPDFEALYGAIHEDLKKVYEIDNSKVIRTKVGVE